MLKTTKYKYYAGGTTLGRRQILMWVMLLAMLLGGGQGLLAQTYFTLTNGHYYWFDGGAGDTLANGRANPSMQYLTGFDMSNSWAPINRLGTHSTANSTEIVEQGNYYLALDTTNIRVVAQPTTAGSDRTFNPLCVWLRTGKTGHYYQEWSGYRYYLYASHATGLSIYKVAVGEQIRKSATWYDWDHGLAIEEAVWRDGAMKNSDFWLIFDTLDEANDGVALDQPVWRMSEVNSYQRPEEMIYSNYRATGVNNNTWDTMYYYDNVRVGGMKNYPAGVAATYMPVTVTHHDKELLHQLSMYGLKHMRYYPFRRGFTSLITIDNGSGMKLEYGHDTLVRAYVNEQTIGSAQGVLMEIMPEYTEYVEEHYRYGINLSGGLRTTDEFGSAGIPKVYRWYYYRDYETEGSPYTKHDILPSAEPGMATVDSVKFAFDGLGSRYMEIDSNSTATRRNNFRDAWEIQIKCVEPPMRPLDVYLTVSVFYSNGITQTHTDTINIFYNRTATVAHAKNAPVIKGNLHGGGKMANVSGNTSVIVHNTDYIYAVYGGNDIAGWVQGDHGATLQVGTRHTDKDHPVNIGWLYGGGCGYYRYGGVYSYANGTGSWGDTATILRGVNDHQYVFHGGVYDWNDPTKVVMDTGTFAYEPLINEGNENGDNYPEGKLGGTIPYVKTTRVTIGVREENGHNTAGGDNAHEHNDYISIDSLFGGAENAFVGVTSTGSNFATAVDLNVNGGTILAAFGGNNYGGAIAPTSLVNMNINCTKLTDDESNMNNTFFHGFGRDFGIRNVYGGGNMVPSTHASVTFNGGMVDTAFIGGNAASVLNPIGTMECRTDGTLYDVHGYASTDPKYSGTPIMNGHFIYTNPTLDTSRMAAVQPDYVPDTGLYNVHFLFGGNNKADMDNVSFVRLHAGGVGAVLGGGNEGSMINDKDIAVAMADHRGYLDISPLVNTLNNVFSRSTLITPPTKIGAVIAADQNSQIIADYVHGGCRMANVKNSCGVYLAGGSYYDVFAGNDVSGDVGTEADGATYTVITGDAVVHHNVYGGCDGYYHCDDGTGHYLDNKMGMDPFNPNVDYDPYGEMVGLLLPTLKHSNVFVNGGLVKGNVVAGGVMASVGYKYDTVPNIKENGTERKMTGNLMKNGTVRLEISDTAKIYGNVFGGGAFASVYGLSQLLVRKTPVILGGLFAGNDALGQVQSFLPYQSNLDDPTNPHSYFRYYFDSVYDGSADIPTTHEDSLAHVAQNMSDSQRLACELADQASQTSSNGDPLNFYEDGHYNPLYASYVLIEGSPIINSVYGSGNGAWDYDGTRPQFPETYVCPGKEGDVPDQESTFIDINTSGGFIDTVFGGGNGCTVDKDVVILLNNTGDANAAYPDSIGSGILSGFIGGTTRSELITATTNPNYVGTIFGGNNFNDMNTVPQIQLVNGNVKNVYGGGNSGNMTGLTNMEDVCGNQVKTVSTHVLAGSEEITVTDSVFGGSRMSDIDGMAYVEVLKTSTSGIQYLYGGNDVSGNVKGNARIDMANGTVNRIWGGSNGRYDYVPVDFGLYDVYDYGTIKSHPTWFDGTTLDAAELATKNAARITTSGRPDVDSTTVNIWGGNINASVFTGGSMADCRATCLVVDDQVGCPGTGNTTIHGAIYGGGEGRWDDLNARDNFGNRWGNVNGSTHVHLYHAKDVTSAIAYGGGGGGDVNNTYIKTYPAWNSYFLKMFGGCWGSDVHGTTHLVFNGKDQVKELFGGNDFTGNVYSTEVEINSGNFDYIYGGGNGDYPDSYYNEQHANALTSEYSYMDVSPTAYTDIVEGNDTVELRHQEHPNTEFITITFNNGTVFENLYGGGKLGSTWRYKNAADGSDLLNRFGRPIPDTNTIYDDPLKYAYVITNIHGGDFQKNVFGGASGRPTNGGTLHSSSLIYGLKEVNMDNGNIFMSLYGGSQDVNDGYANECKTGTTTTRRPSSIINLTGGTVESNLYGAGYLGMTHGSVYINVGSDAIDTCRVFSGLHGSSDAYAIFKPGAEGGLPPALGKSNLYLNHSIFAGANWGSNSSSSNFSAQGFVGGESIIVVDGKGYNTGVSESNTNPKMNIEKSLFGSGTSVAGGDVNNQIYLRNYGEMVDCHPTKTLESVQRTKKFHSHRTAVHYAGAVDATTAYISEPYSIRNSEAVEFRGFNVAEYDAKVDEIRILKFFEEPKDTDSNLVLVPSQTLRDQDYSDDACGDSDNKICAAGEMVDPVDPDLKHTLLVLNNGIDFNVAEKMTVDHDGDGTDETYNVGGSVHGFGFVTTPAGFSSSIIGYPTAKFDVDDNQYYSYEDWYEDEYNDGYSGFVSTCDTSNYYAADRSLLSGDWVTPGSADAINAELPYTNYLDPSVEYLNYREWKINNGIRLRETAILAHSIPSKLPDKDVAITLTDTNLALARAYLTLPPSSGGHYYTLRPGTINIMGDNCPNLVDTAWYPEESFETLATLADASGSGKRIGSGNLGTGAVYSGFDDIISKPENTFGLILVPSSNFKTQGENYVMPVINAGTEDAFTPTVDDTRLLLSGNPRYNSTATFYSPQVKEEDRTEPVMEFIMTYDPSFATTFLGSVDFVLDEYDANGNLVGPIQVKVFINTIIDEFKDIETNVLAMFNNGKSNEFVRKVTLPVTLDENRDLYITGVKWEPTNGMGASHTYNPDKVLLVEDSNTITSATPFSVRNLFRLEIDPTEAVTNDLNENVGWTSVREHDINIYTLARPNDTDPNRYAHEGNTVVSLIDANNPNGKHVGVLDGRGVAGLNIKLNFDGKRTYERIDGLGYVGKAVLNMKWVKDEESGEFDITIYVKTREYGDTIYLATANSVTRGGTTVKPYWQNSIYTANPIAAAAYVGKSPDFYVQSFQHALSNNVYHEGDVIAIIDTVKINEGLPVQIQGADGPAIQVIRYAGHHHELPSESGVYRGPMIVVSGENSSFTAKNIDFHGSSGAITKRTNSSVTVDGVTYNLTGDKQPDTNIVYGPIIMVKDTGSVTLTDDVIVHHNWNGYGSQAGQTGSDGLTAHPELMGAISVTDDGVLTLKGDVEISHNFSHTVTGHDAVASPNTTAVETAPGNGAVYVDGGRMILAKSDTNTAVVIKSNKLMDPAIHNPGSSVSWWNMETINGQPSRFSLKQSATADWLSANVYLTRTETATVPDGADADRYKQMHDDQTDVIEVQGIIGSHTSIGVRKWFPGLTIRDTIQIAVSTSKNPTAIVRAVNNNNFSSDDNFRVFHNDNVNSTKAYFFRCATFKHQWLAADHLYVDPVKDNYGLNLAANSVLQFNEKKNYCPDGGDMIIYRVQGGVMPYTFTWYDPNNDYTIADRTTPFNSVLVENDLNNTTLSLEERTAKYAASMADTLLLPMENVDPKQGFTTWGHIIATAIDATGECKLYKDIDVRIMMDHDIDANQVVTYWPKATPASDTTAHRNNSTPWQTDTTGTGWSDTARTVHAIASRNYKGVHVTPKVWVDRTMGTISATIAGDANDYIYRWTLDDGGDTIHELTGMNLCPGDTIYLYTEPRSQSSKFIMWDFDPYYRPMARYIVPAHDTKVTAYYGPGSGDYWYIYVNSATKAGAVYDNNFTYTTRPTVDGYNSTDGSHKAGFVNTYNGDIHIYDENGLAWLISRVNGLNGQQSRTFRFNRVLIHKKADGTAYDMKNHLWTPVGAEQHPFMGRLFGVSDNETADLPWSSIDSTLDVDAGVMTYDTHWYEPVVIKNIIVNEPQMNSTGLFGHMDSAGVYNIALHGELIRGSQYVGGIAGTSAHSYVRRSQVKSDIEDSDLDTGFDENQVPTTILTTHYVSGGMLGKSTLDTVRASEVAAKFVGDAVYSGGGIGYGTGSIIRDVTGWNFNRLQGLYLGGMAGYLDGVAPVTPSGIGRLFGRKSPGVPSRVENNYFHIASDGGSQRLGGIVGYAENTIIENNYVYGELNASHVGGIVAVAGDGTETDHNYYQKGSASSDTYRTQAGATMGQSATFEGEGNDVEISSAAYGTTNLTHALNKWVREHNANGDNYLTWRSANNGENSGYPVFGLPGVIHVTGRDTVEGCGEVFYNGITYFQSTTLSFDVENYDESVDSSVTVQIIVHNEARTTLRDSADVYEGYQGYGFTVTPTEAALLLATIQAEGSARLVLTDTLQTQYGCDSIVTLLLIFTGTTQDIEEIELAPVDLKVYPNPTQNDVTVETPGMSRVELYDNEGRRLEDYTVDGDIFRISLVHLPSGMYYLRVHTPRGVTIQKIVKR